MHIISYGNPVDGFYYVGPFNSYEEALDYARFESGKGDWWIVELQAAREIADAERF